MKQILALALLGLSLIQFSLAEWQEVYSDDSRVNCSPRHGTGKNACCCYDSACAAKGWEAPCGGDLSKTCSANQLIGPGGSGDHFTYTEQSVGKCPLPPGCNKTRWSYTWSCCDKPTIGTWVPVHSASRNKYCPMAAFFIGCSEPNEILTDNNYSCKNVTCSSLTPMQNPKLKGNQTVVNSDFEPAVDGLIACASQLGGKSKLIVQSTSRCGKSPGKFGAKGFSAHQVGMAIDTNIILPDGTPCGRNCMAQGYCAFHQNKPSCADSDTCVGCQGQPQNQRNTEINDFLTCAQNIEGLEVGATFNKGDWNHFELPVPDPAAALKDYQPQLKAFCFQLCPGKPKLTVGPEMCDKCPGYHS